MNFGNSGIGILGIFWKFGIGIGKTLGNFGNCGSWKNLGGKNGKNLGENWEKYGFFEILGLDLWEFWDLEKIGKNWGNIWKIN